MDVLLFAVVVPVAGPVQKPFARRLGRPEHLSQTDRPAKAEALAGLLVDGVPALGDTKRW
ncbi:hypothetical protein [Streptomyces acidiscabies]|uniref:hypothetical protein n=1 Tax=Streptomyces acidiscabies TaxID=42234 RepID=UPI0038F7AA50